ncbi:MAG: tryptophan synthase subunit alpha, partial [Bacteroidia bacterium]|nr:tryptophan synthase subunit alpha [Bacteroidia bacterium]
LFKKIQDIKDEAKKGKLEIPKDWIKGEIKSLTGKIEILKADTAYIDSAKIKEFTKKIENLNKGDMDKKDYLEYQIKKFKSEDEAGPIVLIKCYKNVTYKNFVDIIDEMAITNVRTYAVVDLLPAEQQLLDEFINKNK